MPLTSAGRVDAAFAAPEPVFYEVFGLRVASSIPLPASRLPEPVPPDVTLRHGVVPDALDNPRGSGVLFQTTTTEFLFRMPGEASFLVRDGREIIVQPEPGVSEEAVRALLLASPFAALLHQRGVLVLHASVVISGGEAVAFIGFSGMGKSTLAAALRARGYEIYADDTIAVSFEDGRPQVAPGFQQIKLWTDSAERVGVDIDGLKPIRPGMSKFGLPLTPLAAGSRRTLREIYVLNSATQPGFAVNPLSGGEKVMPLIANTYRAGFLEGMGLRAANYTQCATLAAAIPVARLVRPRDGFRIEELVDLVEARLPR